MRLTYTILWIENDPETIKLKSPEIERHLDSLFFDAKIIPKEDDSGIIDLINNSDINLILVDYNLQEGKEEGKKKKTGDEIIDAIRQNRVYTEVVFYSGGPFRNKIMSQLEGVFYSDLEGLPDKVNSIIDLTIKKNQDINNIRGMFIAETIDLENKLEELINLYFGSDTEKKTVCEELVSPEFRLFELADKYKLMNIICRERTKSLAQQLAKASPEKKEVVKKEMIMLEKLSSELAKINVEIINNRNILAHTEESGQRNTLISYINKGTPTIVNDEFCLSIRKNIRKHSKNFDTFIKHIESWPCESPASS
jgi:hypothetical protein